MLQVSLSSTTFRDTSKVGGKGVLPQQAGPPSKGSPMQSFSLLVQQSGRSDAWNGCHGGTYAQLQAVTSKQTISCSATRAVGTSQVAIFVSASVRLYHDSRGNHTVQQLYSFPDPPLSSQGCLRIPAEHYHDNRDVFLALHWAVRAVSASQKATLKYSGQGL